MGCVCLTSNSTVRPNTMSPASLLHAAVLYKQEEGKAHKRLVPRAGERRIPLSRGHQVVSQRWSAHMWCLCIRSLTFPKAPFFFFRAQGAKLSLYQSHFIGIKSKSLTMIYKILPSRFSSPSSQLLTHMEATPLEAATTAARCPKCPRQPKIEIIYLFFPSFTLET